MDKNRIPAYEIVCREELPDIHATGWLLRHKKTKARVMLIETEDENKVFNITFRTPPHDSTGVAHILEHSVLCGSREFPLKDPFVELVKGSLNTFLNAMTYPDKTCYPVASCNDQDFQNLMHVYLDAVFYPNIYHREEIFQQEGWNYHLEKPEGPLTYNGVVYNEMKGAFSSADDVLEREIMNQLFPDTPYGVESGGDPACIPDLTYQAFLDFHRTWYHPSNSFIYLYGNMDFEQKLAFLDESYLSSFEAIDVHSEIPMQKGFDSLKEAEKKYPIAENDSEENNTYLSYNVVIGEAEDLELCSAFEVLDYALLSAPGAPLKLALLEAGIGSDIYGSFDDGILQPYFSVVAKGANPDQKDEFVRVIRSTLEKICKEGVDQKAIQAGINFQEFRYREADFHSYPKGLVYGLGILGNWLYSDQDPFIAVKELPIFEKLKAANGTGYYEELIRKWLLDNTHGCVLSLLPQKGLQAEREKELAARLEAFRSSLNEEEISSLIINTSHLEAYQEEEDSPENIAKIPMLKREDIGKVSRPLSNELLEQDGIKILYHEVPSNGIGYLLLMFDPGGYDVERVHLLGLLKLVLGMIDTEQHSYGDLFNEINAVTGGLAFGLEVIDRVSPDEPFIVKFGAKGKALYENLSVLFDMTREILQSSRLTDTKRLYEIIAEAKSRAQASLVGAGHSTAVLRAASYASQQALFQDELSGIGFYKYIEALERDFDIRKNQLSADLQALVEDIFTRDHLMVDYAGESGSLPLLKEQLKQFSAKLPQKSKSDPAVLLFPQKKNEGFLTAGQVQHVAQCGNFVKKGYPYTGVLQILKVILSYEYLWMNLRVKGGAYGCMSNFRRDGESHFVSYRDPHLHRTLKVYQGLPEFVRSFTADEQGMTKYIIGTISSMDVPRTPQMQAALSRNCWFRGLSEEDIQKSREEILHATDADIRALAPYMEAILSDEQICVVGSENAVSRASDVLAEVKPLITTE